MIVLDYAKNGSLRNFLRTNHNKLNFESRICFIHSIAFGLYRIHKMGLIHRDFHTGNLLYMGGIYITDMGLCKPANYSASESDIIGVLPYMAPEILRGKSYAKAADIYSFGMIMYEIFSGLPPYHDIRHDNNLAVKICLGLRPRFNIKVPQLIVHLMRRCLDANPLNRLTAMEIG
jgi:serine/threonine protein kinase